MVSYGSAAISLMAALAAVFAGTMGNHSSALTLKMAPPKMGIGFCWKINQVISGSAAGKPAWSVMTENHLLMLLLPGQSNLTVLYYGPD